MVLFGISTYCMLNHYCAPLVYYGYINSCSTTNRENEKKKFLTLMRQLCLKYFIRDNIKMICI